MNTNFDRNELGVKINFDYFRDLSNNQIDTIHQDSFKGLKSLNTL